MITAPTKVVPVYPSAAQEKSLELEKWDKAPAANDDPGGPSAPAPAGGGAGPWLIGLVGVGLFFAFKGLR